jgi:hypothetical protein
MPNKTHRASPRYTNSAFFSSLLENETVNQLAERLLIGNEESFSERAYTARIEIRLSKEAGKP